MRHRVAFDAPQEVADGRGGVDTTWAEQFTTHAEFRYERGKEAVEGGGLTGTATFKVKIRSFGQSRLVSTNYRMRDVRRGVAFNIREVDAITDPQWVWIVAESGVAV